MNAVRLRLSRQMYLRHLRQETRGSGRGSRTAHVACHATGNAGDVVLAACVRKTFEKATDADGWLLLSVQDPVNEQTIEAINACDKLVIGGGGLFLPDTNANEISGWQWAVSADQLDAIRVPILLFSVGYNYFPGQEPSKLFRKNLTHLIAASSFAGLRNRGSVKAVRELLPEGLREKVVYQPCTTTVIRKICGQEFSGRRETGKNIAVNMAFDRERLRFGDGQEQILRQTAAAVRKLEDGGGTIWYAAHVREDRRFLPYLEEAGVHFRLTDLTGRSPQKVLRFYRDMDLVLGMRGHAQMIPFGLGCPIVSLGTHDKMKWFLQDIEAEDWYTDLRDTEGLTDRILSVCARVTAPGADTRERIDHWQEKLWEITRYNLETFC